MGLFDIPYREMTDFLARRQAEGRADIHGHPGPGRWPVAENRNLVLGRDTAVELGHPKDLSTSFLLWRSDPADISHGRITVVGPDLPRLAGRRAPFAKVAMVAVQDADGADCHRRYLEMEQTRYGLHLEGYMMRGVSQYQREWSRVSREAIEGGFSFRTLGGALIDRLSELAYVRAAELVFVTSGRQDVMEVMAVAQRVMGIVGAMNQMAAHDSFDCDACAYADVCAEVAELRAMHASLANNPPGGSLR